MHQDSYRITSTSFEPAYLALFRSGELQERIDEAMAVLSDCTICPRDCHVNRLKDERAVCKSGRYARVSSAFPHFGEEDPLRGWRGSGTIFFSWCNLRCVFCQNYDISQEEAGEAVNAERLGGLMLHLQSIGCHNINFVTPEHVVPQILEALPIAIEGGLRLPIVYNTSAYDSMHSLKLLDGIIDIYMPDFKFWDSKLALRYLKAKDYSQVARDVLVEMHRQVGVLKLDEHGIAKRGVLLRHLVMPGFTDDSSKIFQFVAEDVSEDTYINIMSQYYPAAKVTSEKYSELNRHLRRDEYDEAIRLARQAGLWRFDERATLRFM